MVSDRSWHSSKRRLRAQRGCAQKKHLETYCRSILQTVPFLRGTGTLTTRLKVLGRHLELVSNSFFIPRKHTISTPLNLISVQTKGLETTCVTIGVGGQESSQKEIQMFKTQIAQGLNLLICSPTSPHSDDPEELSITHTPSHPKFQWERPPHNFTTQCDVTNSPLGGGARP